MPEKLKKRFITALHNSLIRRHHNDMETMMVASMAIIPCSKTLPLPGSRYASAGVEEKISISDTNHLATGHLFVVK
ncbi:MAG: hypothetical protein SFW63_04040 [Alphaproteobacteria bacterium]|nr:hypothetical protein [Alphaproteobacteria bacterium]